MTTQCPAPQPTPVVKPTHIHNYWHYHDYDRYRPYYDYDYYHYPWYINDDDYYVYRKLYTLDHDQLTEAFDFSQFDQGE